MTTEPINVELHGQRYDGLRGEYGAVTINTGPAILDRIAALVSGLNQTVAAHWGVPALPDAQIALHVLSEINTDPDLTFTRAHVFVTSSFGGKLNTILAAITRQTSPDHIRSIIQSVYRDRHATTSAPVSPGDLDDGLMDYVRHGIAVFALLGGQWSVIGPADQVLPGELVTAVTRDGLAKKVRVGRLCQTHTQEGLVYTVAGFSPFSLTPKRRPTSSR